MENKEFYKNAIEEIEKQLARTDISEEKKWKLGLYTALESYKELAKEA